MRGVKVTVVVDQISMGERYGKGLTLRNNGVDVCVHYATGYNPFSMPIMHHKFFIFGHNEKMKKSLIWIGSFNCTNSAATINNENVII